MKKFLVNVLFGAGIILIHLLTVLLIAAIVCACIWLIINCPWCAVAIAIAIFIFASWVIGSDK